MILRFGDPDMAWLLLVIPGMALVWWRSRIYMGGRARLQIFALRALAVALLVGALVDPRLPRTKRGTGQGLAVALDVSDSVGPETAEAMAEEIWWRWEDWRVALGPGAEARLGLVGKATLLVPPERLEGAAPAGDPAPLLEVVRDRREGDGKRSTNLADALEFSRDGFGPGDAVRLFLLTDGRPTRGDLESELLAAKLRDVRVYPIPISSARPDPLFVESFQSPPRVFVGDEYRVAARIHSAQAGRVRVTLRRSGTILERSVIDVEAGSTAWTHELSADAAGPVALTLRVDPVDVPDLHPENNVHAAYTHCRQVPKVLLASAQDVEDLAMREALRRANLQVEGRRFRDLPDDEGQLASYSAVILDAPAAQDLSPGQQEALRRYVKRTGGGLLMIGGKKSLARGTWLRDTLELALPVYLVPRAEASPFALYLLLDSSSSMQGPPIEQVKFAAKRLISMMSGRFLGVCHFDTAPHIAVPLQQVGLDRIAVQTDVDSIHAAGGTAFTPALNVALRDLIALGTSENHILLLSDGQPSDVFLIRSFYPQLNANNIKVSTVGIGQSVNRALLEDIAANCGGEYYDVQDLTEIVNIFEKEVERLIGPPYEEESFEPIVDLAHPLGSTLEELDLPPLHGYLAATAKRGSELALMSPYGDPVLATWQYGLGRTAFFASDAHGEWSRDWRRWKEGFSPFWEAVIKSVVRSELEDFKLSLHIRGRQAHVVVDAVNDEGRFLNGENLSLVIHPPEGGEGVRRIPVPQVEEGRYEARFPVETRGLYAVTLLREAEGIDETLNEGGVVLGYDPEYRPAQPDRALLERLAATTGGRVLLDLEDVMAVLAEDVTHEEEKVTSLWPLLAAAALLAFFGEILLRRLGKVHVSDTAELSGSDGQDAYHRIAENYLRMAEEYDQTGDTEKAQRFYLKARSFFLKAESEDKASRMWEKYRRLDRGG